MVEIQPQGDVVVFNVQGMHKLWALKSQLTIPRAHIRGARQDAEAVNRWWKGWRVGTHVPGLLTAGTFYFEGQQIFWDVANVDHAIIIDLLDEDYHQLIIEVADPAAVLALLGPTPTAV